ncbi:hypothetical protein HJ01_01441 [Flavobacterium frigoris PS1]|uniref:Uncharacterized protein n=1 Tax=Flavobacterium frigoris (strain PS1) TaxID=1086011 RepID=H7FQI1_FLAFP|nr:hypothetical protein HJ01_01441 [Flavobacterium frigoris PS1]
MRPICIELTFTTEDIPFSYTKFIKISNYHLYFCPAINYSQQLQ